LPWQRPLKNQKKLNGVIKPFQLSTNPEILVKIEPLASEPAWLRGQPLKKIKKNKEKTSVKYIALPATLPSGLNKLMATSTYSHTVQCSFIWVRCQLPLSLKAKSKVNIWAKTIAKLN